MEGQAQGRCASVKFLLPRVGEKVAAGRMRGTGSFKFEVFSFKFRTTVVIGFFPKSRVGRSTLTPALSLSREREFFVCYWSNKKAPGWAGAF